MDTPVAEDIIYHVDRNGRIAFVNGRWDEFARENDGLDILTDAVLGREAARFIAGEETKHMFDLMMRHVLTSGRAVTVPFRCDAPALRRHMQLTMSADPNGTLVFRSRMLQGDPRPPIRLLDRRAPRTLAPLIRICSWCNRGFLDNHWVELEEIIKAYGLFEADGVPEITHGLCTECERRVLSEWSEDDVASG